MTVRQIAEAMDGGMGQRPTRPSNSVGAPRRPQPHPRTVEIISRLGLRYPPANTVDREAHTARVALLAEDCADIHPAWLDEAARQWSRNQPFFPKASELRPMALAVGRRATEGNRPRALPAPRHIPGDDEPLTLEQIAGCPAPILRMGISLGELTAEQIAEAHDRFPHLIPDGARSYAKQPTTGGEHGQR